MEYGSPVKQKKIGTYMKVNILFHHHLGCIVMQACSWLHLPMAISEIEKINEITPQLVISGLVCVQERLIYFLFRHHVRCM